MRDIEVEAAGGIYDVSAEMRRKRHGNFSGQQERLCIVRVKPDWGLPICELVVVSPHLCAAS